MSRPLSALFPLLAVAVLPGLFAAGCAAEGIDIPSPPNRFYFPTGILHVDGADGGEGRLFVASSNFDKRFFSGRLHSLELSEQTGLPAFGEPVAASGPAQVQALTMGGTEIASFAGEIASWTSPTGGLRLFIPSRAEESLLNVVDATGTELHCLSDDCLNGSPSLTALMDDEDGKPRAPEPYGVAVSPEGEVWVTHLQAADSPVGSRKEFETYVVKTPAEAPEVTAESFLSLGTGPTNSIAMGKRFAYVTGRFIAPIGPTLRLVDRRGEVPVVRPALEASFASLEARGIALSADETRVFIAGRSPDTLIIGEISDPESATPTVRVGRAIPLPSGPNQVLALPRPGKGSVVVVACSTAGVIALYDEDIGRMVAEIAGVGSQPFGLAADLRGAGARLFATNFSDGRVAVIDVPDLARPQTARLVAHLGAEQSCLTAEDGRICPPIGGTP